MTSTGKNVERSSGKEIDHSAASLLMETSAKPRFLNRYALCGLIALTLLPGFSLSVATASSTLQNGNKLAATILDHSGQPLEHAVLSLHTGVASQAAPSTIVVMDQRELQFVPSVIAIQAGTNVSFPNQDDVRHHVYSFSHPNAFELKLYHGEAGQYQRFEHPGVVVLGCNIHDGMVGYMRVVDTPYFATSNAQGVLTIENVPAGNHKMQLWHPDLGMRLIEKPIKLSDGSFGIRLKLDIEDRTPAAANPKTEHKLQSLFRN